MNQAKQMFVYLIVIICSFYLFSQEKFELYQPKTDRQFLTTILNEHSSYLLDVLSLENALEQLEDSSHLSIFKIDNKPIGFINYEILNKTYLGIPIYQYGFINGIAVAAHYQKKGYGKKLIQYCIDQLKDDFFPYIRLQVRCDNQSAIALYRRTGFEKIEPSKFFNDIEYYQFELRLK